MSENDNSASDIMSGTCTVVIPTFNEEMNAPRMAMAIRERYPDFHVLFMDDNSSDRSKELIDGLDDPMVRMVVRDPDDRGLTASVVQGIMECGTDYFMVMDCDFQHPIGTLEGMYRKLEGGADLVIGTRDDRTVMGFKRWAASWATTILANLYLFWNGKPRSKDNMSGLMAGRTDVYVPVIENNRDRFEMRGWKVLLDLLRWGPDGVDIEEEHYIFEEREAGESHISPKIAMMTLHQCGLVGRLLARIYAKLVGLDYFYDD